MGHQRIRAEIEVTFRWDVDTEQLVYELTDDLEAIGAKDIVVDITHVENLE